MVTLAVWCGKGWHMAWGRALFGLFLLLRVWRHGRVSARI